MKSAIVSTSLGKVQGQLVDLNGGKRVNIYRNIPFAKPPVGSLRFMPPVPAEPWDGVRDATKPGNKPWCVAGSEAMLENIFPFPKLEIKQVYDEDCLHLTVYTPSPYKGKNMPVIVWLYGGGFNMGSESSYDGKVLAGLRNVVVVIPNYRVGLFGFFTLGTDSLCPGNAGLLDQQQALRWVQENIEEFGGDKNNVTIAGESAGGASVHLNILSPLARGLFHKAMSHSGQGIILDRSYSEELRKKTVEALAKELKIEAKDDQELLEALWKVPAKEIMDAMGAAMQQGVYFQPYTDGHVVPKQIATILENKEYAKVPYVIGCGNTEGSGMLAQFSGKDYFGGYTEEEVKSSFILQLTEEGFQMCKKKYLREEHGETKFSRLLGELLRDQMFMVPAVQSAIKHAESGADVFLYMGAFQLKMHHDDKYSGGMTQKASWCECDHGDDVLMIFGAPLSPETYTKNIKFSKEEEKLSRTFMTYVANFARTGNPNEGSSVPIQWPKYNIRREHLVLAEDLTTGKDLAEDKIKFWMEDIKDYLKKL